MPDGQLINRTQLYLCVAFIAGLILSALLRWSGGAFSGFATPLYIGSTIMFAGLLTRAGLNFQAFGFGPAFKIRHVLLAAAGVSAILLVSELAGFILDQGARDVSRFEDVEGSVPELVKLLLLSWTIAAIGEEVAFRIILMQGLRAALGGGRTAAAIALFAQAAAFGLVHLYQGPAGVVGTILSGLIYGSLVLMARGAIWPAFLTHGLVNTIGIFALYSGSP